MTKKLIFMIFIVSILVSSCNAIRINLKGDPEAVKKWEKIAILEIMISPPDSPIFPLVDAGIYNGNFNDIYPDIVVLHEKEKEKVVSELGSMFEKYTKSKMIYGKKVFSILTPEELKKDNIRTFPPLLNNDDFPKLSLPEYAVNFFDVADKARVYDYFDDENLDRFRPQASKICKALGVDGLIVGTLAVNTIEVGMFGARGRRVLFIDFSFFDKNGDRTCLGTISSRGSDGSPGDISHYAEKFREYYWLSDMFLRKLYLGEEVKD